MCSWKSLCALLLAVLAASCGGRPAGEQPAGSRIKLNGAGATFPYPIYSKWFSDFQHVRPDLQINYQSIGSGGGIRQLLEGTVDFGATDGPMNDDQLRQAKVPILHIPTVLGAVVPAYNLPGLSGEIRFTSQALAGIYLGKIKNWRDNAIAEANPGMSLPDQPVAVVHRSDGSGTTFVFTDYLSKVSPEWQNKVGAGTSVSWPVGLGGKGNEGVAGLVRQIPGSMGYIELVYAEQNKIPYGTVRNASGEFVRPGLESTTAAAASVKDMPADFRVSITNAPGRDAYPICSFTWLLIPTRFQDQAKAKAVRDFLNWMLGEGQKTASRLSYAQLPKQIVEKVRATIPQIQ